MRRNSAGTPAPRSWNRSDEWVFVDCAKQSPGDRRSVCYDEAALQARKKHKPANSAVAMASAIGVTPIGA